jgi:E3 ubiquitin-protein ligase HUWE1
MKELDIAYTKKDAGAIVAHYELPEFSPDFHERLLLKLVSILKCIPKDETVILCVLRLLVRLTREGKYARLFRELLGLQALLRANHLHAGKPNFKIAEPSIIIIRQVVEDEKIILAIMRNAVQQHLDQAFNRARTVDLAELLRTHSGDILRDPALYTTAVEQIAKLTNWSSTNPEVHKLARKRAGNVDGSQREAVDGEGKEAKPTETKPPIFETPKKPTLELNYSSGVVHILLSELIVHHSELKDEAVVPSKEPKPSTSANGNAEGNDQSTPSIPTPKLAPEQVNHYAYTLFLLQTLAELLSSYNNCKLEFVNYSRRGQSREPATPSKPRSTMLNYLLNDLLPMGRRAEGPAWGDMNYEKRRGISTLATTVVTTLCRQTPESYEPNDRPDLLSTVRKFVLEGIARAFKDTLVWTGPAQTRYNRFTSLAELCRKLLSHHSPLSVTIVGSFVDHQGSVDIAKLMFEKGFVGLLTNVIADIELDFPDVRTVVNEILESLRELTTSINRLAAASLLDVASSTGDVDEISIASSMSEEEMQERDETPDVFQNSALGFLQGVVDNNNVHRHDRYDEYDEAMDYDEDDEGSESEESDSEDDGMDDDGHDMHVTPSTRVAQC